MANNNPISLLNEFCQKNKLSLSFEKIDETRLCLTISRMGYKEYIQFIGEGRTQKLAKCDAAQRAFKAGIINELKKAAAANASNQTASKNGQLNDLVSRVGQFSMNDGPDPLYEANIIAQTCHIRFFIELRSIRKGISQTKVSVRIHLGNETFDGSGGNDMDAMYNAAGKINFGAYRKHPVEKNDDSSDDEGSCNVFSLSDGQNHPVEYTCLAQLGPPQEPLFIFKCALKNLVAYGVGRNKKLGKNKAAYRMLKKLDQTDSSESVRVNIQSMETGRWADESRIKEIVYSPGNAIGKLEAIDKTRSATLRFIESAKEIGVQIYFTTECRIMDAPDLAIHDKDIAKENTIEKNNFVYLRTSARSTAKKTAKMEAAEKMINLIKGEGAFTNEHVKMNRELAEFKRTAFNLQADQIDRNRVPRGCQDHLIEMGTTAANFLDKISISKNISNYDPDVDYLAELQDMEFVWRGHLKLEIKSSNEIYKLFTNYCYEPFVSCIVKLICNSVVLSALGKSDSEMEAKNIAAYEMLMKLIATKKMFV